MEEVYNAQVLTELAKSLFKYERSKKRLTGWFIAKEEEMRLRKKYEGMEEELKKASILCEIAQMIPLEISDYHVFAGTQDDGFARTYALINPSFKVEEFNGYCDPTAVFGDIDRDDEFTQERIEKVREEYKKTPYVSELTEVYAGCENYTKEVAYFVEQVTGHLVPDLRYVLRHGIAGMQAELMAKKGLGYAAFAKALDAAVILADRYRAMALSQAQTASPERAAQLKKMAATLERVPKYGAEDLYEAVQSFILVWQVICLEQTPNPYAMSVGNADRIFEPYRGSLDRETEAAILKHFLVFFNVADRSWAISQNVLLSGRDKDGSDLTNFTTYALLDAYYDMNLPQPILSVKLHKNTPEKLYKELGRFFFTPGVLTPSLFNDDSLWQTEAASGVDEADLPDISVAGCQEPLIMGKDNGNTTNSWLNLPKILELTLTGGVSELTGEKLVNMPASSLENIRDNFYKNVDAIAGKMADSANGASRALSNERVPFLSCLMGGMESGIDTRDVGRQGTKYNGSGCLIHGTAIIADSFIAIDRLLKERPEDIPNLVPALKANFKGYEDLHKFLLGAHKFGNDLPDVDSEAAEVASRVADIVSSKKNYLGRPFRPDYSSPSTHLLYGYWVGATPDGRLAREMLGYGVDPLYGCAENGLGFRMLSNIRLPFEKFNGGYASHLGVDPKYFRADSYEGKGLEFRDKIVTPLFFNPRNPKVAPFYLYVNVTTPEILRAVLADPKKYAPSGVYIMRIHGTFVNFLDLSPAIQQDIIKRLDPKSASVAA